VNKKFYIVGPHNCPARRDRACLMSGEECHMMSEVQCTFFHYELLERKRQLRLRLQKHKRRDGDERD
jgi:hypothetical protein